MAPFRRGSVTVWGQVGSLREHGNEAHGSTTGTLPFSRLTMPFGLGASNWCKFAVASLEGFLLMHIRARSSFGYRMGGGGRGSKLLW